MKMREGSSQRTPAAPPHRAASIAILGMASRAAVDDFGVGFGRELKVIALGGLDQFYQVVVEGVVELLEAFEIRGVLGRLILAAGQGAVGEFSGGVDTVNRGGDAREFVGDDH